MNWQDFLDTQTVSEPLNGEMPKIYPLRQLSVLQLSGADAVSFLQGQITCNVHEITEQHSRFAALCTPKGRVISTFILVRQADNFLMILPTELINTVKERLQKYVLRAQVTLTLADLCLLGVSSNHTEFLSTEQNRIHLGQRDLLWCAPNEAVTIWQDYLAQGFQATAEQDWQYLDIVAGLPWLTVETSEQFIPQMLNLDALGGISYNKGCYTGQEIVARTHYLGKAKRTLFLAEASVTPKTHTEIINQQGHVLGHVLNAVANKMLIVLQDSESSTLQLNDYNVPITLLTVASHE